MRLLYRSKKTLWYANPTGSTYHTDENGLKSGEKKIAYGTPAECRMGIEEYPSGSAMGSARYELERYGIDGGCNYRAITENKACGMAEDRVVWYGRSPTETVTVTKIVNGETVTEEQEKPVPYNLRVIRKVPTENVIVYFLKEVDVS